jgi:ribosomal protein S24E
MSAIETISDVNNTFLERREITCNFKGIAGKLKKLDAADMISKQFKLDGKLIIPIFMKTQSGRTDVTGTFYVYDSEELAKKQVNPVIFTRLEKAKGSAVPAEAEKAPETEAKAPEPEKTKEVKE